MGKGLFSLFLALFVSVIAVLLSGCAHYTAGAGVGQDRFILSKSPSILWPFGDQLYICTAIGSERVNCHEVDGP